MSPRTANQTDTLVTSPSLFANKEDRKINYDTKVVW